MDATEIIFMLLPLIIGWIADRLIGDPIWLPHPIVGFGNIISWGEKRFNNGNHRFIKGLLFAFILIVFSFLLICFALKMLDKLHPYGTIAFSAVIIFYCLAGKTLIKEVREVFIAVDISVEAGRKQVARIVGRDTSNLSSKQIRIAALETLAENLSDGVIAPLFWFALLGVPGMFAYKMINTLDSMIGYKNERYKQFGCFAARIDDMANFIPARITALLMILVSGHWSLISFVRKYARQHASPNSGFPEAALAGILNCRFGGANYYFGQVVDKPYIGDNDRELTTKDMLRAVSINSRAEILMLAVVALFTIIINLIIK